MTGIFAVVLEKSPFVIQSSSEKASVRGDAYVAGGGQGVANAGAVDKIEPYGAGQLVQPKRNLELSDSDLKIAKVANVEEYVAPRIRLSQLTFNFVFKMSEKSSFDPDALSVKIEGPFVRFQLGRETSKVSLQFHSEVYPKPVSKSQGWTIVPHEPHFFFGFVAIFLSRRWFACRQQNRNEKHDHCQP